MDKCGKMKKREIRNNMGDRNMESDK